MTVYGLIIFYLLIILIELWLTKKDLLLLNIDFIKVQLMIHLRNKGR